MAMMIAAPLHRIDTKKTKNRNNRDSAHKHMQLLTLEFVEIAWVNEPMLKKLAVQRIARVYLWP